MRRCEAAEDHSGATLDLAHLVQSARKLSARLRAAPLLHFALIGGALFGLRMAFATPPRAIVWVNVAEVEARAAAWQAQHGAPPSPALHSALTRAAGDEALLFHEALARGLHEMDPVVRSGLARNMRFLHPGGGASDAALYQRALTLGLHKSDPLVRRRLIERMRRRLSAAELEPVSPAALRAHYRAHPQRWRQPARCDASLVFLSAQRGAKLEADGKRLLAQLRGGFPPERAFTLGDPFLHGAQLRGAAQPRIAARFGNQVAAALATAQAGRWLGPLPSPYGLHFAWLHRRVPAAIPPFEQAAPHVLADWRAERERAALHRAMQQLRARYQIRLREPQR